MIPATTTSLKVTAIGCGAPVESVGWIVTCWPVPVYARARTAVVTDDALLAVLVSPPPAIVAVLVIDAGAVAAMATLRVTTGADWPAGSTVDLVQLTTVAVLALQSHPAPGVSPEMVRPVGITSPMV